MVRKAALILAIALSGCDSIPHAWTRQEIIDISRSNAEKQPQADHADIEQRVADLEKQVAILAREQVKNFDRFDSVMKVAGEHNAYSDDALMRLFKNDETLRKNVNALRATQGWAPIETTNTVPEK